MADRDGLGDLPLFDTEVRPVREFVAQEQRQEDDYQYITRMYSALARLILDLIEDICDQMERTVIISDDPFAAWRRDLS